MPLIVKPRDLRLEGVLCLLPRFVIDIRHLTGLRGHLVEPVHVFSCSLSTRVITMGSSFTHVIGSQQKLIRYSLRTLLP